MNPLSNYRLGLCFGMLLACAGLFRASGQDYEWTTMAGTIGGLGFRDGPVGVASFKYPKAVATDVAGNLYLADTGNHTIRKITPAGMVTTFAGMGGIPGTADGSGDQARFNTPIGIAVDGDGNVFVADSGNHTIRKISPAGAVITLAGQAGIQGHADGAANAASFSSPGALALAPNGDLSVADTANHLIRRITRVGQVTTIAGQAGIPGAIDGATLVARFNAPTALTTDDEGVLYISDSGNRIIRKITPDGNVTTLAGLAGVAGNVDGIGSAARFSNPAGIVVDATHNVYVADNNFNTIRKIAAADAMVTTFAGKSGFFSSTDGIGANARFSRPAGMAMAGDGSLLVVDSGNFALRHITPAAEVTTLAVNAKILTGVVDATGSDARFSTLFDLALGSGGTLYIADSCTIRTISPPGTVTTWAGTNGLTGSTDASGADARFTSPRAVTLGPDGYVYVADVVNNNDSTIRKISPAGAVSTLAGMPGTRAVNETLNYLTGVAVDSSGNIFTTDTNSIWKITPQGDISLFAGLHRSLLVLSDGSTLIMFRIGSEDGSGSLASFYNPSAVVRDAANNLYVTESGGGVIRKVTPAGQVTTLAGIAKGTSGVPGSTDGTGSVARFNAPHGIAVDAQQNLYITDTGNHTIRKISPAGVVTTIGGIPGYAGCGDGAGNRALFNAPSAIAVDANGTLYLADTANHRVVQGVPAHAPHIVIQRSNGTYLSAGAAVLEFGSAAPGSTGQTIDLTVWNTGTAPLVISDADLSGNGAASFDIDRTGLPDSIPVNGSGVLRILFTPGGQGPLPTELTLAHNAPDGATFGIALTGMGNEPPVFSGYAINTPSGVSAMISLTKLLAAARDPEGDALRVTAVAWPGFHQGMVTLLADSIRYAPNTTLTYTLTEGFLVTITDARGGSVTGTVNVTVLTSAGGAGGGMTTNPAQLTVLTDGKVNVVFHGIPGRSYLIQRSSNLSSWVNFVAVTADSAGTVICTDPAPPRPNGYYRLAMP